MGRQALIVFVKSPEAGRVKSRLAADIGARWACRLYRHFVEDLLDSLGKGDYCLHIFFQPPDRRDAMAEWLGNHRRYHPQNGGDLGERMQHAFEHCFSEGFEAVILVGGDIPELTGEIVSGGFAALQAGDAVIGPSHDGGYYLIGFRPETFAPEAFAGISWGTDGVLKRTCEILETGGRHPTFLPRLRDIDTYEDLIAWSERRGDYPLRESRALRLIRSMPAIFRVSSR